MSYYMFKGISSERQSATNRQRTKYNKQNSGVAPKSRSDSRAGNTNYVDNLEHFLSTEIQNLDN
jgi:hypothetical protein